MRYVLGVNMEGAIIENNVSIDAESGEILNPVAIALSKAQEVSFSPEAQGFVHVRNDCSAAGGCFKVGDSVIAKSITATLIAARVMKDAAPFVKKGEVPKLQDWVQILFVDNKYGNLKSTLIKTRSISSFSALINAAKAVNESPVGIEFSMRFMDAEGENETGKFKYKYIAFERSEGESQYKQLAIDTRTKLDSNEMQWPSFDNEM